MNIPCEAVYGTRDGCFPGSFWTILTSCLSKVLIAGLPDWPEPCDPLFLD